MFGFKNGDEVVCKIKGILIEDAKIHISDWGGFYICHNNPYCDGSVGDEMFGYKYSWAKDGNITELRKKGEPYVAKVGLMARASIGCDPEFFFMKDGKVVGSEEIIPKTGIKTDRGNIIIDGVQAELNPIADTCRERLMYSIARLISVTKNSLPKGVSMSFDPLVPIEISYLTKLSDKAKHFGCTPSFNAYDDDNKISISDSSKYPFRPAGGHIHIGNDNREDMTKITSNVKTLIPLLDIIVGNTCVLVDRHEGNKERRKVYGRAGEYRTPKHGVEYRTLSNFWLKSYPLMSMVFGLTRMALAIIHYSTKENNFVKEIMDAVDQKDIIKAINTNDFDLALNNFSKIRTVLEKHMLVGSHSLDARNIPQFLHFIGKIKTHGLEYWFKMKPEDYWSGYCSGTVTRGNGWENFLACEVASDMKKK